MSIFLLDIDKLFYPEKSKLPHSGLAGTGSLRKGPSSD